MRTTIVLTLFLATFFSCTEKATETVSFALVNNLDRVRVDAGFTINDTLFASIQDEVDGQAFYIQCEGKSINYQLEDVDGDGQDDQLFLIDNFEAKQQKSYQIVVLNEDNTPNNFKTSKETRTNVHFATVHQPKSIINKAQRLTNEDTLVAAHYQMEGPAWENDKVAFRNYFDQRNGIDIFGKRTAKMVLQNVGLAGSNYHESADWGMDILKVGASLGAGAIAIEKEGQLYRVTGAPSSFQLLLEGPLRSKFKLAFDKVEVGDKTLEVEHIITISAGQHYYKSHVEIQGLDGDEKLVTGIVNLHSDTLYQTGSSIYTFDQQAEDGAHLGMAVICPDDCFMSTEKAPDEGEGITNSYLLKMKIDKENGNDFYFLTAWETQNPAFNKIDFFEGKITQAAIEMEHPLELATVK